jgi:cobalt-zinc-cadmium efflux system membrane fusion protein
MRHIRGRSILIATALLASCRGTPERPQEQRLPAGTVVLTPAQVLAAGIQSDTARIEMVSLPLVVPATLETPEPLSARVGSIVEGRVDNVLVLPGDKVSRGAPLMHIHSHELATAVRDFASAEAQLSMAQSAYDRSQRLLVDEAVPREEVERRHAALEQARAEYARSREVMDHLSPSPQGDVTVRATRAGTVFAVHVRAGTVVTPGTPLVDLGDETQLWATGFVPENAAVLVRPGTQVSITVDAVPDTIPGRVVRMGGMVDSLRRAVEVRVSLDRVPRGVRPGMFASVVLPSGGRAGRVVLPDAAVQRMADGDVVFLQETPGRFRAHPVRAVSLDRGRVAVEGLAAGVIVVTRGAYYLRAALQGDPGGEG